MEKKKLELYRKKLLKEKERLRHELTNLSAENYNAALARSEGAGGDQNFEDHMGDAATDMFDRERDLSLEQNIRDLVEQVEMALGRIDNGTYGVCAICKKPIDEARLRAIPYTNLCFEDKKREERPR